MTKKKEIWWIPIFQEEELWLSADVALLQHQSWAAALAWAFTPALPRWFYKNYLADGSGVWGSIRALGAGRGTAVPSVIAARARGCPIVYSMGRGDEESCQHDARHISQQSSPASTWDRIRRGICGCWGSLEAGTTATNSLTELQVRQRCLFSHWHLHSTQPVEKGLACVWYCYRGAQKRGRFLPRKVSGNFTKPPCSTLTAIPTRCGEIR